jgi:quercetin dioxygenase-like cupin family protein
MEKQAQHLERMIKHFMLSRRRGLVVISGATCHLHSMESAHIVERGTHGVLHVLGPTIELLTSPDEPGAMYCVMLGTIPPGGVVPLHSHADVESFYVLSGSVQVLSERGGRFEWLDTSVGQFVHVPGRSKHAFRNTSGEPVVQLITTTPRMGKFFREIGSSAMAGDPTRRPTAEVLARFQEVATRYGYWNASPEENAAVGISGF